MTRYELGERIGVGGMAEIFRGRAVAAGGFEKPVAIKRILPHLSQDQRFVKLLISEAKLTSQLRHRNIVQIFDVGLGGDGQFFLVMEYVDGADLRDLYTRLETARKRLPMDLSLHIVAEVCDALDYAHRARGPDDQPLHIVHRDVSPANILLSRSGEVKLTDFGIAKRAEEHTGHGGVRGKFAYISPEQAVNEHVDARGDVYSAGVVLYELVLGHRLFSGMPDFDALAAVREGKIKRPRSIDADIDPELETILLTALAMDPAERFQDAGKMGSALRSLRYSLEPSGGDPASEIARILERAVREPESKDTREPTVVRIKTAAGFTSTGLETFVGSGVLDYDEFEDEETNALDARRLSAMRRDTTDRDPDTAPVIAARDDRKATPTAPMNEDMAAAIVESRGDRPATPTVRDVFPTDEMRSRGAAAVPQPESHARSRNPRVLALTIAVVIVAVASFAVASLVLTRGTAPPAGPPDAGVDATPDAMEMPADIVPDKKKKKRKKKKSTKKKSTKKSSGKAASKSSKKKAGDKK